MKKKNTTLAALLFFSLLPMTLFLSCDKDTNCYLEVQVYNGSTENPISGASVELYQTACDTSDYNYTAGVTDENGVFKATYPAPGILKVRVRRILDTVRPDRSIGYRRNDPETSTRLKEGETVTATVHLNTDTLWMAPAKAAEY